MGGNRNISSRKDVERRDGVTHFKDQACRSALYDIGRIAAQQADLLVTPEVNSGGEVQGLLEPLLDLRRFGGIGAMRGVGDGQTVIGTQPLTHHTNKRIT